MRTLLFACLLLLPAVAPSAAEQIGLPLWILDEDDNYVEDHSAGQLVVSVNGSEAEIRGPAHLGARAGPQEHVRGGGVCWW